jgi:hypothetical protein
VLGQNAGFVLMMAAGSVVGSFVGVRLLGVVPSRAAAPAGGDLARVGGEGMAALRA